MRLLAAAALALCSVGCAPGGDPSRSEEAIVGGTSDPGDSSIVYIHLDTASTVSGCTGTVIAPRLILTAAHCFDAGATPTVGFASSYSEPQNVLLTPVDTWFVNPEYSKGHSDLGHDEAVILLKKDAGVPTLPYHAGAPEPSWIGVTAKLVGYGLTSESATTWGERRSISVPLSSYTSTQLDFVSSKTGCRGDSGGPALLTLNGVQTIVGVASQSDCRTVTRHSRIDGDLDFINAHVAMSTSGGTSGGQTTTGGAQLGGCDLAAGHGAPGAGAFAAFAAFFGLATLRTRRRTRA